MKNNFGTYGDWYKEFKSLFDKVDAVAPPFDSCGDYIDDDLTPSEAFELECSYGGD